MTSEQLVGKRFRLGKLAGSGGMGAVYRATDTHTGADVALKLVPFANRPLLDRFARETRVLAELNHPAIVRYVDHGLTERGEPFLVMEWLEGEDLGAYLGRARLFPDQAIALVRRVADGLAAAHARRIIHRDLKPSNLFLPHSDPTRVKLLDFGIAHFDDATRRMTGTGVPIGTPGYMAPEQARGDRDIDARVDVFSLGCVLFECLSGRAAFVAAHQIALLAKILLEDAPRLSDVCRGVPGELDDLVARMLSKQIADRPADGAAVRAALDALHDDFELEIPSALSHPVPSALSPALTRGERQLVSVVLAGAMIGDELAHADTAEPESDDKQRQTLNERLEPYGARAEWLVDGSVVITLAARGAATDQAIRAARCALAVRGALPAVPIVLSTGKAMLTDRLPVGDAIDRAAAMLRSTLYSPSGSSDSRGVVLDALTAGLLPARFDVAELSGAFLLHGEREVVDPTRRLLGKATPFVGRAQELALLKGAFGEVIEERAARAVLVTAAAGLGKSRLREEFVKAVSSEGDSIAIWYAFGDSVRAGSPLGLLAEALRHVFHLRNGEPIEAQREKVRAEVSATIDARESARVTAFLGELVGCSFPDHENTPLRAARNDPMLMGEQMRRAWLDFLGAVSKSQPVLLILEDLHWGDAPTIKFVDIALRELRDCPIMVLALARDDVDLTFPKLWSGRPLTHLKLADLSHRASERLVRQMLGSALGDTVVSRIVEQAAGNPFYLEELMRATAEGRADALPGTVLAMVQARLSSLDDEARRVLRAASVFGQVFWRAGVSALVGGDARATAETQDFLAELVDREVIIERERGKFEGQDEFAFRHAIVRDAAYETLTESDRTLGHKLAGQWLEQAGEREAGVVAEHLERGGELERAIEWHRKAARQAIDGNDFDAAIAAAERGIACGAEGEAQGNLQLLDAEARLWKADYQPAMEHAQSALALFETATSEWYAALAIAFASADKSGNWSVAARLANELCARAPTRETTKSFASALARCASHALSAGRSDVARGLLEKLNETETSLEVDDPALAGKIEAARAMQAYTAGEPEEYLERMTLAASRFEAAGDVPHACSARGNAGYGHAELGEFAVAERILRDSLGAALDNRLHNAAAWIKHNLGLVLALESRFDESIELERTAIDAAVAHGDKRLEVYSRVALARILMLAGDAEAAEQAARVAVELAEAGSEPRAEGLATLSRAELALGRSRSAQASAADAYRMLDEVKASSTTDAIIRLAYAESLAASGHLEPAKAALAGARDALLARAAKITSPELRESFLRNVPENARTLEWACELLG